MGEENKFTAQVKDDDGQWKIKPQKKEEEVFIPCFMGSVYIPKKKVKFYPSCKI